jgi:hypothetical protein
MRVIETKILTHHNNKNVLYQHLKMSRLLAYSPAHRPTGALPKYKRFENPLKALPKVVKKCSKSSTTYIKVKAKCN